MLLLLLGYRSVSMGLCEIHNSRNLSSTVDPWQLWNMVKLLATPSSTPAFFGGGLLGYVMYDVTHYYLHHGQPSKETIRNLKVRGSRRLTMSETFINFSSLL